MPQGFRACPFSSSPASTSHSRDESMTEAMPAALTMQSWPKEGIARVPYSVYLDASVYRMEQERIFRGSTWSYVALEAELPNPGDFKSTYVGATPVVVTRNDDRSLSAWVNRCAHRGAMVCRAARGNSRTHICAYH